ncbi:L-2-hydroxyglutarate oxidase [Allokutzneria sp. A3M-2-11 16]|uniref:L-2-hydroxyglutarate oxidase n=1 Tax=Allokutzneria sp. A3M-2-11 16 TaxID=2962043 RepID=UPI0020B66EA3|nr:L-2-hydroxyglutarate oxidase [Allokutzneria sp. A3M-2-11 16]MCP3799673.1 L-2-hydroxyglutarate oxidase [Allokutzneria sp. A3M-2-11 16]
MHVAIVGGGIVGLAVAHELATVGGHQVTVLEKESDWATHQTGHNSGVIHAGLYYKPGSHKAKMCVAGNASMVEFARRNGVEVKVCGKLVVATSPAELPHLRVLEERAVANGVPADFLDASDAMEIEPEAFCVAALHVRSTGVIDYREVCNALVARVRARDADLRTGTTVRGISSTVDGVVLSTTDGELKADFLVNCAGLHSDRVARMAGLRPTARIVPFRGEYYELRAERRDLVRGLIYPVPDPRFPFLGVHLTRMLDGTVHAGPNAVLAMRREGYRRRDVTPRDLAGTLAFPGFWRMARKHVRTGIDEMARSVSRKRFAASLARLVPAITADDLVPAESGVRAQALNPDGSLVDDFLIETAQHQVHVLNAPSPAATSALEIARHIATHVPAD